MNNQSLETIVCRHTRPFPFLKCFILFSHFVGNLIEPLPSLYFCSAEMEKNGKIACWFSI